MSLGEDYKVMLSSFSSFLRKLPSDLPKSQRDAGFHWCLHTWNIWSSLMIFSTPISWRENRSSGKEGLPASGLLPALVGRVQVTVPGMRLGLWADPYPLLHLLISQCVARCQVRATFLLSRCFAFTLFCHHIFPYFLPFFHLYIINPFTIHPSTHPFTHSSQTDDFLCARLCARRWLWRGVRMIPAPNLVGEAYVNMLYIFSICK